MDGHKSNDETEAATQNTSVADTTMDSAVHNGSQDNGAANEVSKPVSAGSEHETEPLFIAALPSQYQHQQTKGSNDSQQEISTTSTTSTAAESAPVDTVEASGNKEGNGNGNGRGHGNPRGRGRGRGGFRGSPRQYNNPRPPFRRGGSDTNVGYRRHELLEVIRMQHMKVLIYTSSTDLTAEERQAGIKAARTAFDSAVEEWTNLGITASAAADAAAQSALNAVAATTDAPAYAEVAPASPEAAEA